MTPRSTLCAALALAFAASLPSVGADAYTGSRCFSARIQNNSAPFPLVAGMTRISFVGGAGQSQILNSGFFDGAGDLFSAPPNFIAGSVDCDQNPDAVALWGYAFSDSTVNEGGMMRATVTAWARDVGSTNQACDFVNNPTLWQYSLFSGPPAASLWTAASSFRLLIDGLGCVDGRYFQIRMRSVAEADFSAPQEANSCFTIMEKNANYCVNNGNVCL